MDTQMYGFNNKIEIVLISYGTSSTPQTVGPITINNFVGSTSPKLRPLYSISKMDAYRETMGRV